MSDNYEDVASVYQALIDPESFNARKVSNAVIGAHIAKLPDGAHVLDAACGTGWDAIAICNGLPAVTKEKRQYHVCASDIDAAMVGKAQANAKSFSFDIDIRQGALEDLGTVAPWQNKFDAVIVSHAIYTFPDATGYAGYDAYFIRSLEGVKKVLKPGGMVWIDNRDWDRLVGSLTTARYSNTHGGEEFVAEYTWNFGPQVSAAHKADIVMWNDTRKGATGKLAVNYAGKTRADFRALIQRAGFKIAVEQGADATPADTAFITYGLTG